MPNIDPSLRAGDAFAGYEPRESLSSVAEAELLALARINLENLLAGLDMSSFQAHYPVIFERMPQLEAHRPVVDAMAGGFVKANETVENYWQTCVKPEEERPDEAPKPLPFVKTANPEASRLLAEVIFQCGLYAEGDILARKGNYSIHFEADSAVFHYIARSIPPKKGVVLLSGVSRDINGLPVFLIERLPHQNSTLHEMTFSHEREHVRQRIIDQALDDLYKQYIANGLAIPEALRRRESVERYEAGQKGMIRSELLCILAEIELLDMRLGQNESPQYVTSDGARNYLLDGLKERLLNKDSVYHRSSYGEFDQTEAANIVSGIVEIRDHYAKSIGSFAADRMTKAMLAQYPLTQWSQVGQDIDTLPPLTSSYAAPIRAADFIE